MAAVECRLDEESIMPDHACSLIVKAPQSIPRNAYTPVRFPYDAAGEPADADGMHVEVVDGVPYPYPTAPESALIRPAHDAWALVVGAFQFEPGDYTEIRHRINRDPFGPAPDWTATTHLAPSPGMQCCTFTWGMHVSVGVPLAMEIHHNASTAIDMVLAEFKVIYRTDPVPAGG